MNDLIRDVCLWIFIGINLIIFVICVVLAVNNNSKKKVRRDNEE